MWSGVTVRAGGRAGSRAMQELVLSQRRMLQPFGFTVQSHKCTVSTKDSILCRMRELWRWGKATGWYMCEDDRGRRGQGRQLSLVKKCRDCGCGVTEPHLSFTGMELPK